MKKEDILIRDPFVLVHGGKYYLYGTRSLTTWSKNAVGTDVYISEDMENWTEPIEVFHKTEGYWAESNYWAPEVYEYRGAFYMFITFAAEGRGKGTAVLKAERPEGPFVPHSKDSITPADWECLDGTLYIAKNGTPYMIFCHEWVQVKDGQIMAVQLSEDLSEAVSEPRILFRASQGKSWIVDLNSVEQEDSKPKASGGDPDYVTDGPFAFRTKNGRLGLLWSSFSAEGYTESLAWSDNGDIDGNWSVDDELLFRKDGGHGMLFTNLQGELMLCLHSPNLSYHEHPAFYEMVDCGDTLAVK